jgi:hypothetical protein
MLVVSEVCKQDVETALLETKILQQANLERPNACKSDSIYNSDLLLPASRAFDNAAEHGIRVSGKSPS